MAFLDRIRARAYDRLPAQKAAPAGRLRASSVESERWNVPDPTQATRQATLYANLTWLQIAISKVAEAVASTPFQVSQRTSDGLQAIEDHLFEMLLQDPNPDQDQGEFFEATVSWRAVAGNCYWWLNRARETDPPEELWIIPADQIRPVPDGALSIRGYLYRPDHGTEIPLEPWEVLHLKTFNPLNRYVGLSAVQALAMDAAGDIASQEYNANFYGRDNAKASGILAFADYIEEGAWNRIREDWKEQHGGVKNNRVMRLRGVGAGGVEWIQTQLSQVEIQYLEQRRFTMEEIFARFAPGLASILAVNATEANSTAGKDTFLGMAVYPVNQAIGRKITQKLLPAYGAGLVGAFEDVRRVDTEIELKEQAEYSKTHTLDEVRAKYYQDKPIGDERGKLLPAEIGSGLTDARKPEDKPPPMLPPPVVPEDPAQAMAAAGKALDRRRWRDKAVKAIVAGRGADVPFDPDYLTDDEAMSVRGALKRASTADDVWRVLGEG
jgi:HK97 family phage portal protein